MNKRRMLKVVSIGTRSPLLGFLLAAIDDLVHGRCDKIDRMGFLGYVGLHTAKRAGLCGDAASKSAAAVVCEYSGNSTTTGKSHR